jgi:hypothetical protein
MLTRRMQIQAIANRLGGTEHEGVSPHDFEEPWRSAYKAIISATPETAGQVLNEVLADHPGRDTIIAQIFAATPGPMPVPFDMFDKVSERLAPITWLWPNWIPRGMLSLLGAVPGAGKSYVALDLARRIITGEPFPDGSPVLRPGANVLYVDAEVVPQMINERAMAWEMDKSKLGVMLPEPNDYIDFSHLEYREKLIETVFTLNPALVIVDSLSTISSKGENSVEDVRGILGFLNGLAVSYQIALLLIHHLRKRNLLAMMDLVTIDDFRGSSHIIAMSRSVLGLSIIKHTREVDRNGPRRLEVVKTNMVRYPEPLGVEFVPLAGNPDYPYLLYGDPAQPYKEPTEVEMCAEWLEVTLEEYGPMKPQDIVTMAMEEKGYSRATVYRARDILEGEIESVQGRRSPNNHWALEGDDREPHHVPTQAELCEEWLLTTLREHGRPMKPKDVVEKAKAAGYVRRIVYEAKKSLELREKVYDTAEGKRDNEWALSGGEGADE